MVSGRRRWLPSPGDIASEVTNPLLGRKWCMSTNDMHHLRMKSLRRRFYATVATASASFSQGLVADIPGRLSQRRPKTARSAALLGVHDLLALSLGR